MQSFCCGCSVCAVVVASIRPSHRLKFRLSVSAFNVSAMFRAVLLCPRLSSIVLASVALHRDASSLLFNCDALSLLGTLFVYRELTCYKFFAESLTSRCVSSLLIDQKSAASFSPCVLNPESWAGKSVVFRTETRAYEFLVCFCEWNELLLRCF